MEIATIDKAVPTRERAKPEVLKVGDRKIIANGHWNDRLVMEYVLENGQKKWLSIGELARFAWGQNNIPNKKRARRYLSKLWRDVFVAGAFMSVRFTDTKGELCRSAQAVKIYDPDNEEEKETLREKLKRLLDSKDLTKKLYDEAMRKLDPDYESNE